MRKNCDKVVECTANQATLVIIFGVEMIINLNSSITIHNFIKNLTLNSIEIVAKKNYRFACIMLNKCVASKAKVSDRSINCHQIIAFLSLF